MSRACRVETRVHLVAEVANRALSAPDGLGPKRALIGLVGKENSRLRCSLAIAMASNVIWSVAFRKSRRIDS